MYLLSDQLFFPPVTESLHDGLLAVGGDLSPERLELAYASGIFPWYDDEPILWWSPDPRFVLFPEKIKISSSMKKVMLKNPFSFTVNTAFGKVVEECSSVSRNGENGTWINTGMKIAYNRLNKKGIAISAETWEGNELVGGLYGVLSGAVFSGESMFSKKTNASKFCFIRFAELLKKMDIKIIDCQVYTEHLASLGAEMICRNDFLSFLGK